MSGRKHHYALLAGYKLHWYEIRDVLGRGGFGITYLAKDTNLNRLVAIKEYLPTELAHRDQTDSVRPVDAEDEKEYHKGLERFLREAQTLAKFEHPNIVRVLAVFEENNTGYMVMNYESGIEFQTLLKGKRTLEESELMGIIMPLLDGLEMVHGAGFIHRDIKPHNILIRPDGSPVLIDFGSARQALGGKTKTLTSLVSPGYAPYEQYHSHSDKQGPWTDIYALAAVMYRCILGRPPVNAVDRSEAIIEGMGDSLVSAREIGGKSYTVAFLKAIDHGLQFKPADRPKSITEWKQDFRKAKAPGKGTLFREEDASTRPDGVIVTPAGSMQERTARPALLPAKTASLGIALVLIAASAWIAEAYLFEQDAPVSKVSKGEQPREEQNVSTVKPQSVIPTPLSVTSPITSPKTDPATEFKEREQRIAGLLENADMAMREQRLVTPPDNNAHHYYMEILSIDKDNNKAVKGLEELSTVLIGKIDKSISSNQFDTAREWIGKLEQTAPDANTLNDAHQSLLNAEKEYELKVVTEKERREAELAEQRQQEKIDQLLKHAQKDLEALRLTTPEGNNALEKYHEILAIKPEHRQASIGITSIAERYITLANEAAGEGSFDQAMTMLDRAESVTPNAENIQFAKHEIVKLKEKEEERKRIEAERLKQQKEAEIAKGIENEGKKIAVIEERNQIAEEEQTGISESVKTKNNMVLATPEENKIHIQYERLNVLFNYNSQKEEEFRSSVKKLVNNAGFTVTNDLEDLLEPNLLIMVLRFSGSMEGAGKFWKWSISLKVKRGNIELWHDGYQSPVGPNQNTQVADSKFEELINKFISEYKS